MARLLLLHRFQFCRLAALFALAGCSSAGTGWAEERTLVAWQTDYREAIDVAKAEKRLLLVWFCDPKQIGDNEKWEAAVRWETETNC